MLALIRGAARPALRLIDPILAIIAALISPFIFAVCRAGKDTPATRAVLDAMGVAFVRHHYYEPVLRPRDIRKPLDAERSLPGVDLNAEGQLALVSAFGFGDELERIPLEKPAIDRFGYENGRYSEGDAEMLYNMIRHFKPSRIVEVGSGQSTLMALLAIAANRRDDPAYQCRVICIEPFEQPWLDDLGVEVVRERIEECDDTLVSTLEANDIFFVDSSHVIRPQGDVQHIYLRLAPQLRPGVLFHVHDVFTPRDYPAKWVLDDRRLWDEQYLLEAFLSCNDQFEVLLAMNWLANNHRARLGTACPMLLRKPEKQPGAFWMRRAAPQPNPDLT